MSKSSEHAWELNTTQIQLDGVLHLCWLWNHAAASTGAITVAPVRLAMTTSAHDQRDMGTRMKSASKSSAETVATGLSFTNGSTSTV